MSEPSGPPDEGTRVAIVFARKTFVAGDVSVPAGSHWPEDDVLVEAFPDMFTDDMTFGIMHSPGWTP